MSWLSEVLGTERPVVGMVHFPALRHTPLHDRDGGISKIVDVVERDLAALVDAGFDAVMFCNEADRPYALEAPIEAVATMSAVVAQLAPTEVPFGVGEPRRMRSVDAAIAASIDHVSRPPAGSPRTIER